MPASQVPFTPFPRRYVYADPLIGERREFAASFWYATLLKNLVVGTSVPRACKVDVVALGISIFNKTLVEADVELEVEVLLETLLVVLVDATVMLLLEEDVTEAAEETGATVEDTTEVVRVEDEPAAFFV